MHGYEFDEATAVQSSGDGCWRGEVHDGWDIGGNANGGYVLAILGRAMRDQAGRRDPVTLTAHYLAPSRPGPVEIEARVIKAGKRFATLTGEMRQGDRVLLSAIGAFGDAAEGDFELASSGPPELPPREQCPPRGPRNGGVPVALMSKIDVRLHPDVSDFSESGQVGNGEISGWFSFADGRPNDTLALLLATDAFLPAVFTLDQPAGWVPTVELNVQIRGVPAPGPLRCQFRTRFIRGGCFEEDGEVWDSNGRLVALSRQFALAARA
jgi:acyl-CoA thioesterase